jgi:serine protease Do
MPRFISMPASPPAPPRARARLLAGLLIGGALLLPVAIPAVPVWASGPQSFAPIVKRVLPAVVNIAVTQVAAGRDPLAALPPELQRQLRGRRPETHGAGSGFVVDAQGYIVTNNHVVGDADRIIVGFSDGRQLRARLIGTDELTDVALIKVDSPTPLPFVTWGDSSKLESGDWIIAAGNPFGLGGSVTAGIVSARVRDLGEFDDFIQLDAPINPGNSGGPMFDTDGNVVGMNTAILSPTGGSVGIGFAIPSEIVSRIVTVLREKGRIERGWLGVSLGDDSGADNGAAPTPPASGVLIAGVDRTGPAARAGVRPGDMLMAVNGEKVESRRSVIRSVAAMVPGNAARLQIRRQGRDLDISVPIGRRPTGQD